MKSKEHTVHTGDQHSKAHISHNHSRNSCGSSCCGHEHHHHDDHGVKAFIAPVLSFVMLIGGLLMSHFKFEVFVCHYWAQLIWYLLAFIPVGLPVIKEAIEGIANKDFFNEFSLMTIACAGAFCIRELPEAVGVMLFYSIGETLQHGAVDRATRNISKLLDVRGEEATVMRDGKDISVAPENVEVGEIIIVNPGERVPLDGVLESSGGIFDTSALTGESVPREIAEGEEVLSGMISTHKSVRIKVNRPYSQSALSRILDMVNNASSRKAHAELFIRKFARVYTPIVIGLAIMVVLIPFIVGLFDSGFNFVWSEWIYRALVFLVISCPCALVISVPLGYFAGIGVASRLGVLFKGGNYLESIRDVSTVAFDKTGTLTTGKFSVEKIVTTGDITEENLIALMASAETGSSHPLAKALVDYVKSMNIRIPKADLMEEKAGYGVVATVGQSRIIVGNFKMLKSEGIDYPEKPENLIGTLITCAVDGKYAGYVVLGDTIKADSLNAIATLRSLGVNDVVMLSGDRKEIVTAYASRLGIQEAHGDMLPQDKAQYVEKVARTPGRKIAFVGDGMNDAPVLALSNVGVAMGGLGSDVAIESADIVIQTDQPSRLATAIKIGRFTHRVVTENIVGAISIKVIILALGALGYASLWAAVFADVGVAMLAVLNSMRIMWKKY